VTIAQIAAILGFMLNLSLHRDSLPKNADGGQPRIQGEIVPKNFGKNYMSDKI
jgi:hypothetical protein